MTNTAKYIERAEQEIKRKNYDMAMDLYLEILQIDPDSEQARMGVRRAAMKKLEKRYPSPFLAAILNLPTNLLLLLASLAKARNWILTLCESGLRRDPRNTRLNLKLGQTLLELDHRKGALAAFKVVTEFDHRNLEALKILGHLLYENKEIEQAIGCFEKALKINPRDQDANKMRKNLAAEGAIKRGGFEQARSARDLAKSARSLKDVEAAQKIVRSAEDISLAIAELEPQVEEHPGDARLLMRLGKLHVQARNLDKAVDCFLQIVKGDPEHSEALERLGDTRIRRMELRLQEAEQELHSGTSGAESRVKRLRREFNDLQLQEFKRRVELHPTDLSLRFRLGKALLKDGATQEAVEQLQQAVKDPKQRVATLHLLGRAFGRLGILDLAIKQMEEAAGALAAMNPQKKAILYDLAQTYEHAGRAEQALETYKLIYEADIAYKDVGQRLEALSQ